MSMSTKMYFLLSYGNYYKANTLVNTSGDLYAIITTICMPKKHVRLPATVY